MYSEKLTQIQRDRSQAALALFREFLPLMAPVLAYPKWTPDERETVMLLTTAAARSSESVILLTAFGQLWDAELLVRSVIEGSMKFCYLLQDKTTFEQRHAEFSDDLLDISFLKDHRKAEQLLAALPDASGREWDSIRAMLLPQVRLAAIDARFPKSERQRLDSRWGFTNLITSLASSGDNAFAGFTGFAHGYAIASHILHADYVGIGLPMERDIRSALRRESVHVAHLARLITDVLACVRLRLMIGYRFVGQNLESLSDAIRKMNALHTMFEDDEKEWLDVEYGSETQR